MEITNFEILPTDSLSSVVKRLNSAVGEKMIIIAGHCKAFFDGRIKSTLEDGDRFLVIKKDLSILMHGPTGVKPLNWQKPQAGSIHFKYKEDSLEMFTQRIKTEETLTISFHNIQFLALWHAYDATEIEIYGDESDLVKYLVTNPELIAPGFQILKTEYYTDVGPVDIRGLGQQGETIVEVKKRKATPQDAHQLKRYIEFFQEKEKREVKGILIAPDFPEKVQKYLDNHGLKSKVIKWEEIFPLIKRPKDTKLEEFFKEK